MLTRSSEMICNPMHYAGNVYNYAHSFFGEDFQSNALYQFIIQMCEILYKQHYTSNKPISVGKVKTDHIEHGNIQVFIYQACVGIFSIPCEKRVNSFFINIFQYIYLIFFNQHQLVHILNNILKCAHNVNVRIKNIET